jgi:hypothetical protein
LGEEYWSLSSSLCSFLHSPVTSYLRLKYSPQHPILRHPQLMLYIIKEYWKSLQHILCCVSSKISAVLKLSHQSTKTW